MLAIICALLLPKRVVVTSICVALYSFMVLYIAIDTMVFPLYKFHINGMVINLLLGGAAGDIFQFSFKDWFVAGSVAVCVISVELAVSAFIWKSAVRRGKGFHGLNSCCLIDDLFC